jgi:peptide/nickel transport system substrate-binding protein
MKWTATTKTRTPLLLAAAASAIAALAAPAVAQDEPVKGGTLVVARPADVNLGDPKFTNDNDSLWAQGQVFANLLQNSPDGLELQPSLAESYEISPDATEFTFKLRADAKFCDGSAITSEDVKFSFDRAIEPDSGVSWQFAAGMQVDAVDPTTVKITLPQSNVAFASYLTLWGSSILSKAHAEKVGVEGLSTTPLGSGAFCVETWDKGQRVVLKPNPGYWNKEQPYVDAVELRVVQDDNARVLQVRTGEVDIALAIPFSLAGALEGVDGVEMHQETIYGTAAIVPNMRKIPALADVKVRQAIARVIDRQAMIDAVLFGQGREAQSPFYGPGILFWTDEFAVPTDVEAAKALMAESNFPQGFSATLIIPSGDQLAAQTATIFADQLSQIGIQIAISPVEAGTWWEMWSGGEFELVYKLGTNDVIDPAMNIPFDFWTKELGGSDSAFSGYNNAEIIEISTAAQAELDATKRGELYKQLQRIAMDEYPQFYLFHPTTIWATRDNVKGFAVFPTKAHRFWETWKVPE